jgi:hypothetical protein
MRCFEILGVAGSVAAALLLSAAPAQAQTTAEPAVKTLVPATPAPGCKTDTAKRDLVERIVFTTPQATKEAPDQQVEKQAFGTSEAIRARVRLQKPFAELLAEAGAAADALPDSVRLVLLIGGSSVLVMDVQPPHADLSRPTMDFDVVTDVACNDAFCLEAMRRLAGLPEGRHEIGMELRLASDQRTEALAKGAFTFDTTADLTNFRQNFASVRTRWFGSHGMPAVGMSDPALEKQVPGLVKALLRNDKPVSVALVDADWRAAPDGRRTLRAAVTLKRKDDSCWVMPVRLVQDPVAGKAGAWSKVRILSAEHAHEIDCAKAAD